MLPSLEILAILDLRSAALGDPVDIQREE